MTMIFDSARLGNPTKYAGRVFGRNIPDAWPEYHSQGYTNPNRPTDADDPTDYAPVFRPTPEDDRWNAETSPLNHTAAELLAEADAEFFVHYAPTPNDWSADALSCLNGQFGYTREN